MLSLEGDLLALSTEGQRILEIDDVDQLIGTCWIQFWTGRDRIAAQAAVKSARGGTPASFTGFFVTGRGTPKWWHVMVTPVMDSNDRPEFLLAVSRDVTALVGAQTELKKQNEEQRALLVEFQKALLPAVIPTVEGLAFDGVYTPGTPELHVGGDWYDVLRLQGGQILLSIGDVCGHSLSAAFVMAKVAQSIRAYALDQKSPSGILQRANDMLRGQYPDMTVTAWVGIIDGSTLSYACAGHPWPMLQLRGGQVTALPGQAPPLGVFSTDEYGGSPFLSDLVDLTSAELLVLYTDGLIEAKRNIEMGEAALRDLLTDAYRRGLRCSASDSEASLTPDGARDDVAILTVRIGERAL